MADILVVAEQRRGVLNPVVAETIGAASELATTNHGKVIVAILAKDPSRFTPQLSLQGVDEVIEVKTPIDEFQSDIFEASVLGLISERNPSVVIMPHSIDSLGYAPAVAVKGGYGLATDVFGLRYEGNELVAVRQAYQEKAFIELDFPGKKTVVLTIRGGSFKAPRDTSSPVVSQHEAPSVDMRTHHIAFHEPATGDGVDLASAEYVLAIGRGVADEDNMAQFEELADMLGFTLGCSRPIADNGWLPKYRQVGQSGKTVSACKIYIALGISGSVQHLAGMKHVPNIIAVNKDPEASIFTVARYGVVGDMFAIANELKSQLA